MRPCLPGTELKKLLATFGIAADDAKCACLDHARTMDDMGCDWCEKHIDEIVRWLRVEAEKRGLPFFDYVGKVLVRLAIRKARFLESTVR